MLYAQESRATVLGRVADSSSAVIPGAKVRAINVATNTTASSITNEEGNYEIPYLLPGVYRMEVELSGFKKAVRDGVELHVADRQAIDFTLELGALSESVTVGAEGELLETTNASVGTIMQSRQASELPIVGGNAFYLARLTPGVLSSGGRSAGNAMDTGAGTDIIVNGVKSGSSRATGGRRWGSLSPAETLRREQICSSKIAFRDPSRLARRSSPFAARFSPCCTPLLALRAPGSVRPSCQ